MIVDVHCHAWQYPDHFSEQYQAEVRRARAGAEVDLTALPIPKPAAIAITTNAPSSHLRRSMFPPSLRPVPLLIVVAMSTGEPVPCHPAR